MDIALSPVIDFGPMPIANAFLDAEQFADEYFYRMVLGYDPATAAIGLVHTVAPEMMFHDHYAFFSSTSQGMQRHFAKTAERLRGLAGGGLVVEVGSNDGIMLEAWKQLGVPAIGVEVSSNVAAASRERGHDVIDTFISEAVVDEILERGSVSLVYGANVSCHIEGIVAYARCVARLIGEEGVFVFEDPYFLDMVEKTSYDQVYDEHVWYFTLRFINRLFEPFDLCVFDCEHVDVHGGELRMFVGSRKRFRPSPAVARWLAREQDLEGKLETFRVNTERSRNRFVELLQKVRDQGKRICGFGASSKGVVVCNYCGIGPELVPFITDNTPIKQGKFTPGVHIPIVPQECFTDVDVAVNFAWNHAKEIERSQHAFREAGGRWITHVPEPRIY